MLLTLLAVAAPLLAALVVAAVMWFLVGRSATQPATEPVRVARDLQTWARDLADGVRTSLGRLRTAAGSRYTSP
jgi:hypothetical protein